MAIVKPFPGLRPTKESVAEVASPPYDVINSEEAREMAKGHPLSFLHVVKPEIDLSPETHIYDDSVYAKGAENLKKLVDEGIMKQDEKPCYYVYRQKMGDHVQTGLVACSSVDDYQNDIIKKHEFTRKDKEDDRTRHVATLNANTGPVFLTYKAVDSINALMAEAMKLPVEYDFTTADGVQHTFWVVSDGTLIEKIRSEFGKLPYMYVADGHHRSASGSRARELKKAANPNHKGDEEYNGFLSVIFPDNQMKILAYNRIVHDLNGNDEAGFLAKIGEKFDVQAGSAPMPEGHHDIRMLLGDKWYKLTPKAEIYDDNDPVASLDVSILQNNLLAPVLGIEDPRTSERISFAGGLDVIDILEKKVKSGKGKVAFSLYPTSIIQLMNIADAGKVMPPKSTWFVPKLRSGLVVHLLD